MDPIRVRARVRIRFSVRVRVRVTLAQSCMLCGPLMSLPRVGISGCNKIRSRLDVLHGIYPPPAYRHQRLCQMGRVRVSATGTARTRALVNVCQRDWKASK